MFAIGEFSNLCLVTTKTLRHYDVIGLFKPKCLNEETGYRYYDVSQLKEMEYIKKLKEYGFSLEEIKKLKYISKEELHKKLEARIYEQTNYLKEQKNLIKKMKYDLERLKKGESIMENVNVNVEVVNTQSIDIISVREVIAIKDFCDLLNKAFDKLNKMGEQCVSGPIARYHCKEFDPNNTDIEIGIPIAKKVEGSSVLEGGLCVKGTYKGTYKDIPKAYEAVVSWVEKNGYTINGYLYEKYLNSPNEVKEEDLVTEIYFPVCK